MKTRFLTALTHELPGVHFRSAWHESPGRRFRVETTQTVRAKRVEYETNSTTTPRVCAAVDLPPDDPMRDKTSSGPLTVPGRNDFSENFQAEHGGGSSSSCVRRHGEWRFALAWRKTETENPASNRLAQRITHGCVAGLAGMLLVLSAGCKSSEGVPYTENVVSAADLQRPSLQMTTVTNQLDPMLLCAPTNLFTLGPGDKLDIEMEEETNSLVTTVVGPDGKIYFNLLPGLDVWGLTLGQTRQMLEHQMSKYVRGRPQINVTLRDVQSKRVWMLGHFQQPGVYSLTAPTTLLEAVASAGGAQSFAGQKQISQGGPLGADLADLQHSFIVRHGKMLPVNFYALLDKGDLSQNIYLQPDDFIYFTPAYTKEVYVLGAVTLPQPVQYVQGMTLVQAIAGAYGTVRNAWLAQVTIVRGTLARPQVALVNYYDIVKGKVPDVPLEPHDIVYVPFTPYRYLRNYLDTALNTFASSVAINAGTRATAPSSGGASGITIPIGSGITIIPPTVPPVGGH